MHAILWTSSLLAIAALAAPSYSPGPDDSDATSTYFQLLASKVEERQDNQDNQNNQNNQNNENMAAAPACDLANTQMPQTLALPPPTGLILKHVAIGRGTQNYTCSPNNATAEPVAIGAFATLYNASCIAATNPNHLTTIPNSALQSNPNSDNVDESVLQNLDVSGQHFFLDNTTPFFNLDTATMQLGQASCTRNASVAAPAGAPIGQGGEGFGAIAWLQLLTKPSATGNLKEVYRLNTAGGKPPLNCSNMAATFEVQYAAEYWFWQGN